MAFQTFLSSQSPSISEAVIAFKKPVEQAVFSDADKDTIEKSLWQCWSDFFKLVATVSHSEQDYLINFIQELRLESGPTKSNGNSCQIWGSPLEWKVSAEGCSFNLNREMSKSSISERASDIQRVLPDHCARIMNQMLTPISYC